MKRLIDQVDNAEGMERLTQLVSAAEPFRPNPFTKRRALQHLQQKRSGPRPLLKAWSAAAGLMFLVGSAVAGTGWWRAHRDLANPSVTSPPAIPSPPSPPAPVAPPSAAEPRLPPTEATPLDTAVARGTEGPPSKTRAAKRRAGIAADETPGSHGAASTGDDSVPLPTATGGGEDPAPVVRAIRALRSERNPALAEQLLQEYLRTHPQGALAEDALALLIETASALRSPSAADRAGRYLELYPNGRYRATARRVLSPRP